MTVAPRYARVILLAGAGFGQSEEMLEQAKDLTAEGRFAFLVPLELLDRDQVIVILSFTEEERYDRWKPDVREWASFLFHAVDELKLTESKPDRALPPDSPRRSMAASTTPASPSRTVPATGIRIRTSARRSSHGATTQAPRLESNRATSSMVHSPWIGADTDGRAAGYRIP